MSHPRAVLRQPESYPESRLPPGVQPLPRPPALGRAVELAFLRWEKRRLAPTERFWRDFGMQVVSASSERIVARGAGPAPCIAIAVQGARDRFIGAAFRMSDDTELERYTTEFGAKRLAPESIPGGGHGVELCDPSGRSVWLLQGQQRVECLPLRDALVATTNTAHHVPRVNRKVRSPIEPARVVRLGHVVLQTVDFQRMADWYIRVLGLIPTDVQFLADGSPNLVFCRLDLGAQPADHHTVVLVGGIEEKYEHSAYEVVDLDALGQGQQVLRAQGHRHMWGIGRHVLGSQLFDYWFDPDGFEYEHYTDGDVFSADVETEYSPLEFGSIWAWGDDAPASMKPKKDLRSLLRIVGLLRRRAITPQRLKLLGEALDPPARPWG
jgi:catechol 2,3-dioxygenase-like lactoylglutathione lyase family enzyme